MARAAIQAEAKEHYKSARFYGIIGILFAGCALFFFQFYLPYGHALDAAIMEDSITQGGGPLVHGTYGRDATVLTWLCAIPAIGSLGWAVIEYGRMQAVLHKL